ncbi:alpha/beta hydrolase [Thermoleptolyngbya sp.]
MDSFSQFSAPGISTLRQFIAWPIERLIQSFSRGFVSTCVALGIGVWGNLLGAAPALSAERLTTYVGPLQLSISVDALETYAKTGQASGNLRLFLRFLDAGAQAQLRRLLQHEMKADVALVSRVLGIPMAEQVLQSIGKTLQTDSGLNGFRAVRSALILSAANHPDGWTWIDWMRQYPTPDIRVDLASLMALLQDLKTVVLYQDAAAQVVIDAANQEAAADPEFAYDQLPDLSQPGPYAFRQEQLTFDIQATRTTLDGFSGRYRMRVDVYIPENAPRPSPLVIYTHGWGGRLSDGAVDGKHLAAYGFTVAVPEHIGTTDTYRSLFLAGRLGDLTSPTEYVSRQQDIWASADPAGRVHQR